MNQHRCAFACDQPAVGVVPTTNPDQSIRRRPICDQHVKELLPDEPEGFQLVQMFGAIHPAYQADGEQLVKSHRHLTRLEPAIVVQLLHERPELGEVFPISAMLDTWARWSA